jgi:hypothetical protein
LWERFTASRAVSIPTVKLLNKEDVVRIMLLAVGFFAGLWLHETGALGSGSRSFDFPVHFELTHIRYPVEMGSCDRVRLDMRAAHRDGRESPIWAPVLVCERGPAKDVGPLPAIDHTSLPKLLPCRATSSARCFEGL